MFFQANPPGPGRPRESAYSHCLPAAAGPRQEACRQAHPTWPFTDLLDRLKDLVLLIVALLEELGMLSLPEFQTPLKLQFLQHLLFLQEHRFW